MGDRLGTQGAVGILVPDMKVLEGLLIVSELFTKNFLKRSG